MAGRAFRWVARSRRKSLRARQGVSFISSSGLISADYDGVLVREGYVVYDHYDHASPVWRTCCDEHRRWKRTWTAPTARSPRDLKALLKDALAARDLLLGDSQGGDGGGPVDEDG